EKSDIDTYSILHEFIDDGKLDQFIEYFNTPIINQYVNNLDKFIMVKLMIGILSTDQPKSLVWFIENLKEERDLVLQEIFLIAILFHRLAMADQIKKYFADAW